MEEQDKKGPETEAEVSEVKAEQKPAKKEEEKSRLGQAFDSVMKDLVEAPPVARAFFLASMGALAVAGAAATASISIGATGIAAVVLAGAVGILSGEVDKKISENKKEPIGHKNQAAAGVGALLMGLVMAYGVDTPFMGHEDIYKPVANDVTEISQPAAETTKTQSISYVQEKVPPQVRTIKPY